MTATREDVSECNDPLCRLCSFAPDGPKHAIKLVWYETADMVSLYEDERLVACMPDWMWSRFVRMWQTMPGVDFGVALTESVRLQSHYAKLLNMHDGGERLQFSSPEEWIKRLREVGRLGTQPPSR